MGNASAVEALLQMREQSGPRAALRRGDRQSTQHYAYPYLAAWWQSTPWARDSTLLFGALIAGFPRVGDDSSVKVGYLARDVTVGQDGLAESGVERKLIYLQTASLTRAYPVFRKLLAAAERRHLPVSWNDMYWLLRQWDQPDLEKRTRVRRRLLEDFYHRTSTDNQRSK